MMKGTKILGMWLAALWVPMCLTACLDDDEDEGRKIVRREEYTLTVASKRVVGCGYYPSSGGAFCELYAVKREGETEWKPLGGIAEFDYESGHEYVLRISETTYLDYRMGEPSWTEYHVLETLSAEAKASVGVPRAFFPDGVQFQAIETDYAIDAARKAEIESDLKGSGLLLEGCKIAFNHDTGHMADTPFALVDAEYNARAIGTVRVSKADRETFPQVYSLLPPEGEVTSCREWELSFYRAGGMEEEVKCRYDVYVTVEREGIAGGGISRAWLYQDLTDRYADAAGVVVRYMIQ